MRRPVVRFYAGDAAMLAEEAGLRGAGAPDRRRLRHDGVVQQALRQRRARHPLARKAAQFILTSTAGDDVGDDGQPCAAKAIDVMTRKSCPRFSGGKSYQPRRLFKDILLIILGHDRFPEPEKIKRVRRDCRPWRTQCLSRRSPRPGCAGRWRRRRTHPRGIGGEECSRDASGPLVTWFVDFAGATGFADSAAGIARRFHRPGGAIAGSGSDAHARPCLKLSRRVLATRASSSTAHSAGRTRRPEWASEPSSCSFAHVQVSELISKRPSVMLRTTLPSMIASTAFNCER